MEQKSAFESFELNVNSEIKSYLKEISKWSYILSIIGFVGLGFMVIAGFFISFLGGSNNFGDTAFGLGYSMGVGFFYIVIALVYFFPIQYLFKFSKKMKSALQLENNEDFKIAFLNLKSHYKYIGIFAIVLISIYVLIFLGAIVAGALFS